MAQQGEVGLVQGTDVPPLLQGWALPSAGCVHHLLDVAPVRLLHLCCLRVLTPVQVVGAQ
jgi:hypothetical protein